MKTLFDHRKKAPKSFFFLNKYVALFAILLASFGIMAMMPSKSEQVYKLMPGVVFEIETTDHTQASPSAETWEVAVEGKNIKMEILPDERSGGGHMIFKGDKGKNGEVILTDDGAKAYYKVDDAFISKMAGNMKQSKSMIEKAMEGLTPEQRKMIEEAQKKSGNSMPAMPVGMKPPSRPKLRNTGERATKSGYPCVKYEVLRDGKKTRELWVTDWSNIDGGGEARDAFAEMNTFFEELRDAFGSDDMFGSSPYAEMNLENGFPVVMKSFNEDDGSLEDESWLRSATRRTLDPADFEPPAGYKLRSMFPN